MPSACGRSSASSGRPLSQQAAHPTRRAWDQPHPAMPGGGLEKNKRAREWDRCRKRLANSSRAAADAEARRPSSCGYSAVCRKQPRRLSASRLLLRLFASLLAAVVNQWPASWASACVDVDADQPRACAVAVGRDGMKRSHGRPRGLQGRNASRASQLASQSVSPSVQSAEGWAWWVCVARPCQLTGSSENPLWSRKPFFKGQSRVLVLTQRV